MKKKNRRLINTALVVALTTIFSYGIYKTANAKPVSADSIPYTLEINYSNASYVQDTAITDNNMEGYSQYSQKVNIQGNNTAIMVEGSFYANSVYAGSPGSITNWRYLVMNNETDYYPDTGTYYQYCTRGMYTLAFTGYNSNIDTNFTVQLYIKMQTYNPTGITLNMRRTMYRSTDNWASFINRQDFASTSAIYNYKKAIENPSNNYTYTKSTYTDNIANTQGYTQTYSFTQQFTVAANGTTYYCIMIEPYAQTTSSTVALGGDNKNIYNPTGKCLTITGTNIIPTGTYEVIDIPGIMFQILTMPFTFISMAFNVTLFPGTPYSINISQLLLALMAVLVFVFIIKIIISMAKG